MLNFMIVYVCLLNLAHLNNCLPVDLVLQSDKKRENSHFRNEIKESKNWNNLFGALKNVKFDSYNENGEFDALVYFPEHLEIITENSRPTVQPTTRSSLQIKPKNSQAKPFYLSVENETAESSYKKSQNYKAQTKSHPNFENIAKVKKRKLPNNLNLKSYSENSNLIQKNKKDFNLFKGQNYSRKSESNNNNLSKNQNDLIQTKQNGPKIYSTPDFFLEAISTNENINTADINSQKSLMRSKRSRSQKSFRQWLKPIHSCRHKKDSHKFISCPSPDVYGEWKCIEGHQMCDGRPQCPGHEDEDDISCFFFKSIMKYVDELSASLIIKQRNERRNGY